MRQVKLGPRHHVSRTKHTMRDKDGERTLFPPFISLEIAPYRGETGCYLFHICGDGLAADTWHETLEEAMEQAEWEFGVTPEEWTIVEENPESGGSE